MSLKFVGRKEMTVIHIFFNIKDKQKMALPSELKQQICIISLIQHAPNKIPCFWPISLRLFLLCLSSFMSPASLLVQKKLQYFIVFFTLKIGKEKGITK